MVVVKFIRYRAILKFSGNIDGYANPELELVDWLQETLLEQYFVEVDNKRIETFISPLTIINATLVVMIAGKNFYTLDEITYADMSSVKIISDIGYSQPYLPPQVFKTINLKRLEVKMGELLEVPDDIGNLKNLQELYLQSNKIERISNNISHLTKLKKLRLFDNKINDITPVCSLPNLVKLEIGRNEFNFIPDEIGNLIKLRLLDLGNLFYSNAIEYVSNQIGRLENLEYLKIHGAKLAILNQSFGKLVNLRDLSIRNSNVKEIQFSFNNLLNLEVIDVSNNEISRFPPDLSKAVKLKSIYIDNNPIDRIPETILRLPELKIIGISGTRISLNLIENYRRKYPKIVFVSVGGYFEGSYVKQKHLNQTSEQ